MEPPHGRFKHSQIRETAGVFLQFFLRFRFFVPILFTVINVPCRYVCRK
jgi:hypothetical protein